MSGRNKKKTMTIALIVIIAAAGGTAGILIGVNMMAGGILEGADVNISSVEVLETSGNTITVNVTGEIENPSTVSGTVAPMDATVKYNGTKMGTTQTSTINAGPGNSSFQQVCTITITNDALFGSFLEDFMNFVNVTLSISGDATVSAGGLSLTLAVDKTFTMDGMNGLFNLTVEKFGIISANDTAVVLNVTASVNNPSSASITLDRASFLCNLNGSLFGNLNVYDIPIPTGYNNVSVTAVMELADLPLFNDMVDDMLNGIENEIELDGMMAGGMFDSYISTLLMNVTIPAMDPYDLIILGVDYVNSTDSPVTIGLSVDLAIYNPTSGTVPITDLSFNTTYDGQYLGNVTFPDLNVDSGNQTYNVFMNFTIANTSLITEILDWYLKGVDIEIEFTGFATGANIIAQTIAGYQENITLPAMDMLEFSIGDMVVAGTTADTITINTTIETENPAPIDIAIGGIHLDGEYQGSWVGNVSAGPTTLTPGTNVIPIQVVLSGDQNQSAVEALLSEYIAGDNVSLYFNGTLNVSLPGMDTPFAAALNKTVTLEGLEDPLITGAQIQSIGLTVSPPATYSASVTARVNVQNPFNFGINVTYIETDVTFEDPDGYTFSIGIFLLQNTTSDLNISVGRIDVDKSGTPIQIAASSSSNVDETIATSNVNTCCRAYSEYYLESPAGMLINLQNGRIRIQISAFSVWLDFSYSNLLVT
ncbi:MAG: DUF3712 domain-containing protein [Candidatus Hodarchaeota archaeon]